MIELVNMLGQLPSVVGVSVVNGDYLLWLNDSNSRIVTQEEIIVAIKQLKILELKDACTNYIQAGFTSSALGAIHTYDSSLPQDQINLVGAKMAGVDMFFTCTDELGYKSQKLHTVSQIGHVYLAGMGHLQTAKSRFYARKLSVEAATTEEEVNGVVW